jgi:membrane-associated phospholipid phosphatase
MPQDEPPAPATWKSPGRHLADPLQAPNGAVAAHLARVGCQLGQIDRAVYTAVAVTPAPDLDEPLRRLSRAADNSLIWVGVAAAIAVFGGSSGRRAAVRALLAVSVTSAAVNLGVKPLRSRRRPDRADAGRARQRYVAMPRSSSFPSGHAASGFAFAASVGRDIPSFALPLRLLAAAVAYSRVHTGVHYPGDAVIGAIIGASAAQAVGGLGERLSGVEWRQPRDTPCPGSTRDG